MLKSSLSFSRVSRALGFLIFSPLLAGCQSAPLFNLLGSFFPAWMLCLFVGIALTVVLRFLFVRIDFEKFLHPLVVVYPAFVTVFTCVLWLVLFS